jgi:hypothetical protein
LWPSTSVPASSSFECFCGSSTVELLSLVRPQCAAEPDPHDGGGAENLPGRL